MSAAGTVGLAFMRALWAGDLDACDRLLTADASWHFQLAMPQAQRGPGRVWPAREAMRAIVADLFGKFDAEGFTVEPTRVIAADDAVAIEYEANGRTSAGAPYRNFYVTVLVLAGDRVAEVHPYNDTLHMLRLLDPAALASPPGD